MTGSAKATAVLVPTLGRPDRVPRLVRNLRDVTTAEYTLYFVVERNDRRTIDAVRGADARLIHNEGPPTYASCINTAYRRTAEPFLFLGADDIVFVDGWLTEAVARMADPGIGVVGTLDPLRPQPDHSAHSLVRRTYVEQRSGCLDLPDTVLYPYWHGYTDHELVGVAKSRKAYAYCDRSKVEHHHPGWDSLGRVRGGAALDPTYRKGNRHHRLDTLTFVERCRAWMHRIEPPSAADLSVRKFVRRNRGWRGTLRYNVRRFGDAITERLHLDASPGAERGDGAAPHL